MSIHRRTDPHSDGISKSQIAYELREQGLTYSEIAKALGCQKGTACGFVSYWRKKLSIKPKKRKYTRVQECLLKGLTRKEIAVKLKTSTESVNSLIVRYMPEYSHLGKLRNSPKYVEAYERFCAGETPIIIAHNMQTTRRNVYNMLAYKRVKDGEHTRTKKLPKTIIKAAPKPLIPYAGKGL